MSYELEFQQDLVFPDGRWTVDVTASVDPSERIVEEIDVTIAGTGQPARLTKDQLGAVEARAIDVFDETGGAW